MKESVLNEEKHLFLENLIDEKKYLLAENFLDDKRKLFSYENLPSWQKDIYCMKK